MSARSISTLPLAEISKLAKPQQCGLAASVSGKQADLALMNPLCFR